MEWSYNQVQERFRKLFNHQPVLFRAPGRINLIGEHTDYNDGFVMPAAIDKEIVFAMANASDNVTTIHALDVGETFTVDLDSIAPVRTPHWANYLLGVIHKLQERGHHIRPFKCVFGGNIPVGSGLSSSAALECGFVYGIDTLNELGISPTDMILIAQWAEHNYAGVKCGIMDQFSSMMGKQDHVFVLDCRSLEYTYYPLHLTDHELILLDTNVKHSLAGSEYNVRRSECEEGVRILKTFYPAIMNLRDVSPSLIKEHEKDLPAMVFKRCLYVTEEIQRVRLASEDLIKGDIQSFGRRMYETHLGLSSMYEVSCPELDFLVDVTKDNARVLGARMMGGGFGGCTINIVQSDFVEALENEAREKYHDQFGIALKVYKVKIKNGVSKLN